MKKKLFLTSLIIASLVSLTACSILGGESKVSDKEKTNLSEIKDNREFTSAEKVIENYLYAIVNQNAADIKAYLNIKDDKWISDEYVLDWYFVNGFDKIIDKKIKITDIEIDDNLKFKIVYNIGNSDALEYEGKLGLDGRRYYVINDKIGIQNWKLNLPKNASEYKLNDISIKSYLTESTSQYDVFNIPVVEPKEIELKVIANVGTGKALLTPSNDNNQELIEVNLETKSDEIFQAYVNMINGLRLDAFEGKLETEIYHYFDESVSKHEIKNIWNETIQNNLKVVVFEDRRPATPVQIVDSKLKSPILIKSNDTISINGLYEFSWNQADNAFAKDKISTFSLKLNNFDSLKLQPDGSYKILNLSKDGRMLTLVKTMMHSDEY